MNALTPATYCWTSLSACAPSAPIVFGNEFISSVNRCGESSWIPSCLLSAAAALGPSSSAVVPSAVWRSTSIRNRRSSAVT